MTTTSYDSPNIAANPSLLRRESEQNPFVDIPQSQRTFLLISVAAYVLFFCIVGLLEGRFMDKLLLVSSSAAFIATASFPIFFMKKSGFLHPLALSSAFLLLNTVMRKTDTLANGIPFHVALPGYSESALTSLVSYVNLLSIISLVATYLGYFSAGPTSLPLVQFKKKPNALFMPLLISWLVLGVLSLYLLISASGGIQYHLKNMNRGQLVRDYVGNTRLLGAYAAIIQSTIVIPIFYAAFRKNGHKDPVFFGMVLCVAAMAYLTAGRRSAVLLPMLLGMAIWVYKERRLPVVRIALVGFALFLFVAVGGLWREANRGRGTQVNWDFLSGYSVQELAEFSLNELSDRAGTSAAIYPIVVNVPGRIPFNYFQSYLENAYRIVPRSIWPDKPDGIGIVCAETFYNRFGLGGIPPGPLGEAYWSLHIMGIVVAFGIYGMILRVIGNTFAVNAGAIGFVVVYLLTVFRLGPDQISFRVWIFSMVPTVAFLLVTNLASLKGR